MLTPFYMLHQIYFILKKHKSIKKIIISSGGYWSLIPSLAGKLLGIEVFIILNGSDCAAIPSINYGDLRKFPLKKVIEISYKKATTLLPVSSSLILTNNTFLSKTQETKQGYKHFFPDIKTEAIVLHNGIDVNFWKPLKGIKKVKNSFISVFSGTSQFQRKGGDLILEVAKKFPDCKFFLAGLEKPKNINSSDNVVFLGKLTPNELRKYYNMSEYYFQLSTFEGFGVALCEAMACKCIPIGSSVNMIPEIIGDSGYILHNKNLSELENLINKVLLNKSNQKLANKARNQICNNFPMEKREKKLLELIENGDK